MIFQAFLVGDGFEEAKSATFIPFALAGPQITARLLLDAGKRGVPLSCMVSTTKRGAPLLQ